MSRQVDNVLDEVDGALRLLRDAIKGVPFRKDGFRGRHDSAAKAMASLTVALEDASFTIRH